MAKLTKYFLVICFIFTPVIVNASDTDLISTDLKYDSEGNVEVDQKVENTYAMPEVSSGFNYDFEENRTRGIMTIELKDDIYLLEDYNYPTSNYPLKIDAGVGEDLALITVNKRITSVIEFSIGASAGYDFNEEEFTPGINFLITKF